MNVYVHAKELRSVYELCFIHVIFVLFGSLHSYGLPSCRNCEHVSTSSSSHLQHFGRGGHTTTTTTNVTTSLLGLLQLLQQRGISASPNPFNNLHYSPQLSCSTVKDKGGGTSIFSLNLVEKLQSLGLHKVAAWGMMGRCGEERMSPTSS